MKIDSEQLSSSVYRIKNETAVKEDASPESQSGTVTQGSDRVELSGNNARIGRLKTMMKQLPDSRQGKVTQLRQQIADGSYQVSSAVIAGKMLDNGRGLHAN